MTKPRYVILGAGISGLSLGWFLKQKHGKNIDLTILEASDRPGSWIHTTTNDNFLFEQGPRSFRTKGNGKAHLQLIESLNLQDEVIFADNTAAKRYIYSNGLLQNLPMNPLSLLYSSFTPKILKALWKDYRTPKSSYEDESIYDFVSRRFGTAIVDSIFDPMVAGIYAGDIKNLSIKSCFPWLYELEKKYGCVWKGALFDKKETKETTCSSFVQSSMSKSLFTLRNGMQSLIDKLADELKPNLSLNSAATELNFQDGISIVSTKEGQTYSADKLFVTIPPPTFAKLIEHLNPFLAKILREIKSTSLAIVNLGFNKSVLKHSGFGYLIPSKEKEQILGMAWDSCAFPQQNKTPNQTRISVFFGAVNDTLFAEKTDHEFIDIALKKSFSHLQIEEKPVSVSIKRSPFAVPQYTVGHSERLVKMENELKKIPSKIKILGSGFYGIAVNDCIARSQLISLQD